MELSKDLSVSFLIPSVLGFRIKYFCDFNGANFTLVEDAHCLIFKTQRGLLQGNSNRMEGISLPIHHHIY